MFTEEIFKKDINESDIEYISKIYRHKTDLGMTNKEIADKINQELGTSYGESTLRGRAQYFNEGFNSGYDKGLDIKDDSVAQEYEYHTEELETLKKEKLKVEKELQRLEAKEERITRVTTFEDHYIIFSGRRELKVSKDLLKRIKELYCDGNNINISEMCRTLDIPRRDFMLIKNAFNIVHNDVPYIDEELENEDLEDLVSKSIERKKAQYFIKLQNSEIEALKKEVDSYRSKDFLYEKTLKKLQSMKIEYTEYQLPLIMPNKKRSALLDIADMHTGIMCDNYFNKYNSSIMKERMNTIVKETLTTCNELGVTELHVSNLGDCICGIIHGGLIKESEFTVDEQVEVATETLIKMLCEFSKSNQFDKIIYSSVVGNHGRIFPNKDMGVEKENFERFVDMGIKFALRNNKEFSNIVFEDNYIDDTVIVKEIEGVKIYETHGHLDKFTKMASDLGMMFGKSDEVHTAHYHHNKSEEFHECEVFMGRSLSGIDTHAKNMRLTSKAGQRLYIYSNKKRDYIHEIIF